MIEVCGLVIFVNPEECKVEIVPRISEIIGIAAKRRRLIFRGEHQTDVSVLLVLVKVVKLTRVQGDYVASQPGRLRTVLLDSGHGRALRLAGFGRGQARFY